MAWKDIDLDKHAVIEASAGTGKTYSIERLVLRLLIEKKDLTVDQLLILTFTEKAAGELKDRVREMLQTCVDSDTLDGITIEPEDLTRLRTALDTFDTACISTIHGFCQKILQEYAFENNQVFDLEVCDDNQIYDHLAREMLRKEWPRWFEYLEYQIQACGIDENLEEWLNAIGRIAMSMRDKPFDLLIPQSPSPKEITETLKNFINAWDDNLIQQYQNADIDARACNARLPILMALEKIIHEFRKKTLSSTLIAEQFNVIRNIPIFKNKHAHWDSLTNATQKKSATKDIHTACPSLTNIIEKAQVLEQVILSDQSKLLLKSITHLRTRSKAYKQEHGLISFDDMLTRLGDALDADKNPDECDILLAALRKKYRYALIDEFHDTDPVQWNIFKRIFVDGTGDHRIFVVGDPKQAIYAFRGADIFTYVEACEHLLNKAGGQKYCLDTNFRSTQEMIAVFNRMFKEPTWFPESAKSGITYTNVKFPVDEQQQFNNDKIGVIFDKTERVALTGIDMSDELDCKVPRARWLLARCITTEIKRLLDHAHDFIFVDPETKIPRALKADDICVLVQSKKVGKLVEKLLQEKQVPFTYYKKPGLYQSDEAAHLTYMLAWLANPEDTKALQQALMTRFFTTSPEHISVHALLADPEVKQHVMRWTTYCSKRQWPQLFESLLMDTGLIFREGLHPNKDRRLANFEHLFQELTQAAYEQNLEISGLYALLEQRRCNSSDLAQDADLHRLESEHPKVQIMTMHASKGLQFPIVFIADGFSAPQHKNSKGKYLTFHEQNQRIFEIKTDAGFHHEEAAKNEAKDELIRLYYVAMTRARYKVYIPTFWTPSGTTKFYPVVNLFSAPLESLKESVNSEIGWMNLNGEILVGTPPPITRVSPSTDQTPSAVENIDHEIAPIHLVPLLGKYQRFVDSFSALAHRQIETPLNAYSGERRRGEQDEKTGPEIIEAANLDVQLDSEASLLPKGAKTGNAFHDLMEALTKSDPEDYTDVTKHDDPSEVIDNEPTIKQLVDNIMARYRLKNRCPDADNPKHDARNEVIRLAWTALRTPFIQGDACLSTIPLGDRRAELQFYLWEGLEPFNKAGIIPGWRQGLMNGFIDLLFRYREKYYILDWKTNTLNDYTQQGVQQAMEDHNYLLQYRIYTLALLEWLRSAGIEHPEKHLGGAYYLFIRGMDVGDPAMGVFSDPWHPDKVKEYYDFVQPYLIPEQDTPISLSNGGIA
ncbi:MAG: hypothetical protein EOM12_08480 [Verrucomicrobiae bacterium]|nr:hypothetical protein [Verrucomicrobiae bacterium]